jgi:hypothetical protein
MGTYFGRGHELIGHFDGQVLNFASHLFWVGRGNIQKSFVARLEELLSSSLKIENKELNFKHIQFLELSI